MVTLGLILVFLTCYFLYWGTMRILLWKRSRNAYKKSEVPFGYKGILGIGFLPNFKRPSCKQKLIEIKEQHGSICKVRMGSFDCVWLNDNHLIKEAWTDNAFCGRPDLSGISLRTKGFKGGIIFNDGKSFTEQRRFVMQTLKSIGLGKSLCEQFIYEEIQEVMNTLANQGGRSTSTRYLFNIPALNIIWRIITGGSRFRNDDPVISELVRVLQRNMELKDGVCTAFFMPWVSKYFPRFIGWDKYVKDAHFIFDFWMNFSENVITRHRIKNCTDSCSDFYGRKGVTSLATVLQDLFVAGSETTATTLQWICLYLSAFPNCQRKIFSEIELTLKESSGVSTVLTLAHRDRMPYTEAFIKESLRYSTLAPLGMVHCTTSDVEFHKCFIPKGTLLHMNTFAVHFDKKYWKIPEEFMPERFLTPEGKLITGEIPGYLPFSLGRRMCPGAEVARQTLFLATACIVHNFEIRNERGDYKNHGDEVNLNPKIAVSAVPYPHKLLFIRRSIYVNK